MSKLIVALDFNHQSKAFELLKQLNPKDCMIKIGLEMFTLFGPDFVENLVRQGFKVFLDLKYHDIPNTVSRACKSAARLGVWMINVHASGGFKMMHAAKEALREFGEQAPFLIAVTVLTSFNQKNLAELGVKKTLNEQVIALAKLSQSAGLDGVVCSAHEVKAIKEACGQHFLTVTPGIRLENNPRDDQKRIVTPEEAVRLKSDFLVIGRPITQSDVPRTILEQVLNRITRSKQAE